MDRSTKRTLVCPYQRWLALLFVTAMLAACKATKVAPVTGSQLVHDSDEAQMWDDAKRLDTTLQARGMVSYSAPLDAYLRVVVDRLRQPLQIGDAPLQVYVLKDPFLNAFAMPNGTLYLNTGLLARIDNEAQLATVLGHEMAHYARRHALVSARSADNARTAKNVVVGMLAVLAAAAANNPNAARVFANLGDSAAEPILHARITGYSRDLEREADRLGFNAMVQAGYDPREAPKVFSHLQDDSRTEGIAEPYFFGNHPLLAERIANFEAALAEWQAPPQTLLVEEEHFQQAVADVVRENIEYDLAIGRYNRAQQTAERYLQHHPHDARGHFLLGEAHRRAGSSDEQRTAAMAAYENAVTIDPSYALAYRELGLLRREARQPRAAAALRRYLELQPDAVDRGIIDSYAHENPMAEQAR